VEDDLLIYLAGPISGTECQYITHCHNMIEYGIQVEKEIEERGINGTVHIPALDFLWGVIQGNRTYDQYTRSNMIMLKRSDVLALYIPKKWDNYKEMHKCKKWNESKGTIAEINYCMQHNKAVLYDLDRVKTYLDSWKIEHSLLFLNLSGGFSMLYFSFLVASGMLNTAMLY
jgi:hypothetical protein